MTFMLFDILSLLIQVITALVAGTALLRMYIQLCGINLSLRSGIPIAPFMFALTNWMVLPLRRILPAIGRLDTASLVSSYLVLLLKYVVYWSLAETPWDPVHLPIQAAIELISTCISGLFWIVVIYAVSSWLHSNSPMAYLIALMVEPLLIPIRRMLPQVSGIDFSALALILILQILEIVLHYASHALIL
jgi:YggT family protein